MEYEVVALEINAIGKLKDELNAWAAQGFRAIYFFTSNSRVICIMERKQPGKPGRPRKDESTELGE